MAWPIVALFGLAYGTYQTVYFALAMNYTDPRIAASMFSILMAVTNIAQGVGMAMSGFLSILSDSAPHLSSSPPSTWLPCPCCRWFSDGGRKRTRPQVNKLSPIKKARIN